MADDFSERYGDLLAGSRAHLASDRVDVWPDSAMGNGVVAAADCPHKMGPFMR